MKVDVSPYAKDILLDRLAATLADFSYKPGSSLHLDSILEQHAIKVVLKMVVPDSRNVDPEHPIPIPVMLTDVWPRELVEQSLNRGGGHITDMLYRLIMRMEHHEIDEWFKLLGQHVRDPHPQKPVAA